jgi:hypothetical protein
MRGPVNTGRTGGRPTEAKAEGGEAGEKEAEERAKTTADTVV